jgi:hypothetical protein
LLGATGDLTISPGICSDRPLIYLSQWKFAQRNRRSDYFSRDLLRSAGDLTFSGKFLLKISLRPRTDEDRAEREHGSQIGDRQLDELEVGRRER